MRAVHGVCWAVLALILATTWLLGVRSASAEKRGADGAYARAASEPELSPCMIGSDSGAAPAFPLLGEQVAARFTVRVTCPVEVYPVHVVFVLDATDRLSRRDQADMKDAAVSFAEHILTDDTGATKVAAVEFDVRARTLCRLTPDPSRATACLKRLRHKPGDRLDLGVEEAQRVLVKGRARPDKARAELEVMLVFSTGPAEGECARALAAARRAKSQGVLVVAVCVGPECYAQCMRQVASSPRYFYQLQDAAGLRSLFWPIRGQEVGLVLKRLVVTATLSSDVRLDAQKLGPEPLLVDERTGTIAWSTNYVPRDGVTFTLGLEPLMPGVQPLTSSVTGSFSDNQNRVGNFAVASPSVLVLQPLPVPPRPAGLPADVSAPPDSRSR